MERRWHRARTIRNHSLRFLAATDSEVRYDRASFSRTMARKHRASLLRLAPHPAPLSSRTQPRCLRMGVRDLLFRCSLLCLYLPLPFLVAPEARRRRNKTHGKSRSLNMNRRPSARRRRMRKAPKKQIPHHRPKVGRVRDDNATTTAEQGARQAGPFPLSRRWPVPFATSGQAG
jgi:hypothetical protein